MKEIIQKVADELTVAKKRVSDLELVFNTLQGMYDDDNQTVKVVDKRPSSSGKTFKERVVDAFNELNRPLKGKAVYEHAFEPHGMKYDTFSPQLTYLVNNNVIKKHVFANRKNYDKYYYGLPSYFDGDTLKKEYLDKVD